MSDEQQVETGATVNALRDNVAPGESKVYTVAAIHKTPDGIVIAAIVSETPFDVDLDICTLADESEAPKKGDSCRFTRPEDGGQLVVKVRGNDQD